MFEMRVGDIKGLKRCIDAILSLVREGIFEIKKEGINLRALDPSQIAMVNFTIPSTEFTSYNVEEKSIGLNIESLSKVLSRARGKEELIIKLEEGRIGLTFKGNGSTRTFKLPIIDISSSPPRELKINFSAKIKIQGGLLKEILRDASLVAPHVLLLADEDKFRAEANGEVGEAAVEYKKGEVELSVERTTSAVFSGEYLESIVKGCDDNETIELDLGAPTPEDPRPKPICIKYKIGNANLTYFLAPRIERE